MKLHALAALVMTFAMSASAQEAPAKNDEAPKTTAPAASDAKADAAKAPAQQAASEAKSEAKSETKPGADATKKPGDSKATPQRFIPSEQVRSDFDVSFPVDI